MFFKMIWMGKVTEFSDTESRFIHLSENNSIRLYEYSSMKAMRAAHQPGLIINLTSRRIS